MTDKSKSYQKSAFPVGGSKMAEKLIELGMNPFGMDKRFYAACAAMQGILASYAGIKIEEYPINWIAKESYKIADEMLKQENL